MATPDPERDSVRFNHLPVLREEVLEYLRPVPGGIYVDATVGGGGHAEAVLLTGGPSCRVIGIDRDPEALEAAAARLTPFGDRACLIRGRFSELAELLERRAPGPVDGVLADLGVSSPQLGRAERGFSFLQDGPLDMRMDPDWPLTASELVNTATTHELTRIFREYGEERYAANIAKAIDRVRRAGPIETTRALASLIEGTVPRARGPQRIHPATRVFQALRIAVNDELGELEKGLVSAFSSLKVGGRLVLISFHSLEDRIVKRFLKQGSMTCVCPPGLPICRCGKVKSIEILTRRPIEATEAEVRSNPRSRSAKLRAAEKIASDQETRTGPQGVAGRKHGR